MQKIGIYGGTFDPIHHAHLILAREAMEKLQLEKILFVPASNSPHKRAPHAGAGVRLKMLQAAIAGEPRFAIEEFELHRPPPSYTIDTVKFLHDRSPGTRFTYLLGDDNVAGLPTWRSFEELRELVSFVVLRRTGDDTPHDYSEVKRRVEISATEIRNRVAAGESIRYLVPERVLAVIEQERLYREGVTSKRKN